MPKVPAVFSLQDTHWRKFLSIFLALAFSLITVLAILLFARTWETMRYNLQLLMHGEQDHMELAESLLHTELERLSKDLLTFSGTPVILHFFANPPDLITRQSVNADLSNYIQNREDYDQARIIDNNGQELIQVAKRDHQTAIIASEELENKAPDAFVQKVLSLQLRGRIAISPLELAHDQKGEILHPFQPIFHIGAPIFNKQDQKVGILLFTCRGQQFFDLFTNAVGQHHDPERPLNSNNPQILTQEGYWLLTLNKEDEWGFARDRQRRFDRHFPEIWQAMREQGQGQIKTADGLFTFTTLPLIEDQKNTRDTGNAHPAALSTETDPEAAPFWLLVDQVSPEELNRLNAATKRFHLILFLVILAGSLPLLWWIALLLKKKQEDKIQLQAEKRQTTHLSILLQTIIQIHRLIDKERDKQVLAQACCDTLVTSRGYASVWIILLDQEGKVEISAESGLLDNFNQLIQKINIGNPPPCIRKISLQGLTIIDTPVVFCADCPMANNYPRTGVMCASLGHESSVYGYLNVSLPLDFIQDQEENNRFREIAKDIGYALFNLEQQKKKMQIESSLLASEQRLRGITDSAYDAILMMDPQGAISYWNPASEKILGYRAEEALGKNLHTLLAPLRYQAAHQAAFPEFVRTGCGKAVDKVVELSALRKDGHEIPITLSLSAIFQDGGWHAIGILRDMTDHKLMEERMLQSEKMATIAGLAAGVAHEINTPLSAILQSIQVIRQSLDPELARNQDIASHCGFDLTKAQNYFQEREINFFMDGIRESAIKSGKIITNLLQFSRPQKLEFGREDMALLLDKSVELAKNDYNLKKKL